MSTPEEDQTEVWSPDAPEAPADAPDPADEGSVEANAAAAFAAAGAAPPPGALTERPEVLVGAAFAGGVVFAMILKRLVR